MEVRRGVLSGRVAVVTGSSRGLGLAMARLLARNGATVIVSSRTQADVDAAADKLRAERLDVYGWAADVGEWSDVVSLRDFAVSHGDLDIWVNNAGASGVFGPTASTPIDDFDRVVRTNIAGTFHGSRAALGVFVPRDHGNLVNVYGRGDQGDPVPLQNAYASSKGWVRQFTETLQAEVKGSGVFVSGFNPGMVKTDMLARVTAQRGYAGQLKALPTIVGLWGQSPDAAARPILELVTSSRHEYRDLTRARRLARGAKNALLGRAAPGRRMKMQIDVVDRVW